MAEYHFDPAAARDRLVEEIRNLAEKQGFSKVVIGISGGIDLTSVFGGGALCSRSFASSFVGASFIVSARSLNVVARGF